VDGRQFAQPRHDKVVDLQRDCLLARALQVAVPMVRSRWRLVAFVLAAGAACACAAATLWPERYVASGGVLVADGMLRAQYASPDPHAAAALVRAFIAQHKNPLLVDPPLVVREEELAAPAAIAGLAVLLGLLLLVWRRRAPSARSEKDLVAALGVPIVAVRPLAARDLSRQLAAHWFRRGRPVLAVVSAETGEGRTRVAVELARAFSSAGESTLLIDANFRAPGVHRAFGLRNRAGLADFLHGGSTRIAHCADNLSVMVAGHSAEDPLELLSRPRMLELLAAASKRYRVVLVDTPEAALGPDLQLFAAFAGGALVVTQREAGMEGLRTLERYLRQASARVVGTVLSPA
jgi:Mrp family chromosome partitioning ATPase